MRERLMAQARYERILEPTDWNVDQGEGGETGGIAVIISWLFGRASRVEQYCVDDIFGYLAGICEAEFDRGHCM
jgi:hypothetical protein